MPFRAIILDLDGLIIDRETLLLCIWQEIDGQHASRLPRSLWQIALGTTHNGFDLRPSSSRSTRVRCQGRVMLDGATAREPTATSVSPSTGMSSCGTVRPPRTNADGARAASRGAGQATRVTSAAHG